MCCWWKHNAPSWAGHLLAPLCMFFKLMNRSLQSHLPGKNGWRGLFINVLTSYFLSTYYVLGLQDTIQGRGHIETLSKSQWCQTERETRDPFLVSWKRRRWQGRWGGEESGKLPFLLHHNPSLPLVPCQTEAFGVRWGISWSQGLHALSILERPIELVWDG